MTISGAQLRERLIPVSGPCGAVYVEGLSLPPPPAKWTGFHCLHKRIFKKVGKWKSAVDEHHLGNCSRTCSRRERALLVGPAVAGVIPAVSLICEYNSYKALLGRAFRKPRHRPAVFILSLLQKFSPLLLDGFQQLYHPMSRQEYIDTARRRQVMQDASDLYDNTGWRDSYSLFSSFVKSEKLISIKKHDLYFLPLEHMLDRLINGPHPVTHIIAGPKIKPFTRLLKKLWGPTGRIFYAATSNVSLNFWFNQNYNPGKFAVCSDYTMFDNSHSSTTWEWIEGLYRALGMFDDPDFSVVMDAWRAPHGHLQGRGFCYEFFAYIMNASGRDDTALANALINGFAMFLSVLATILRAPLCSLNVDDIARAEFNVSIMGDDSLVLLPDYYSTPDLPAVLSDNLSQFGLEAKIELAYTPFDMVYLGMRPYLVDGVYWWGRTIGRALYKWGWKLDPNNCDAPAWMTGVAEAEVITSPHVPVLYDVAVSYLRSRVGCKRTPFVPDFERPWTQPDPNVPHYDVSTVAFVAHGYGVDPRELLSFCEYLLSLDTFPCIISHPVLEAIMMKDDY